MFIAIAGASGQLGHLVVQKLKGHTPTANLVALARTPAKATDLGVGVREADYDRPATLAPALAGVHTLLLISASELGQREHQHRNLIEAAKQAAVQRIVYTSLLHADSSPLNLAGEHLATEHMLHESGIAWTILRNGWYTENYTAAIPGALAAGVLVGSAGNGRIAAAPRLDYAEAAVAVLTTDGHTGKCYELAADSTWTLTELAAEISRQTGRDIPYRNLPEADYAATLAQHGLPAELARAIASWDVGAAHGALDDDSHTLSRLIGRPTTPMAQVVTAALKPA
ncbi:MAG: SDR family oxidoreductase [Rhodanobacter sp.]|nr:MAG: SDR family oxidoreductase [Rhodanobacter sp.]TAM10363.1 MAG: SDR family oxidoreductase [Rhodanobacter sp.]TAM34461.1 MAG: SDR family oxidoreductase [Rhodanobacter sp.]